MAHRSENCSSLKLSVFSTQVEVENHTETGHLQPNVWLFHLPTEVNSDQKIQRGFIPKKLKTTIAKLPNESTICFLAHPYVACNLIEELQDQLSFKLWIAIKRNRVVLRKEQLPDGHVSLVVFAKYKGTLKHNRTQISYTFCPACGKTTKDYGGKKHLYSPYGTLMSDVWRDVTYVNRGKPRAILNRLKDLFGHNPYNVLSYYDTRSLFDIPSIRTYRLTESKTNHPGESRLINGDCLEVLRTIPENSIDFVFADPPYNIKKRYDNWDDGQDISNYFKWCDRWISESARVLKPHRTIAIINIPLWIVRHFAFAKNILEYQDLICWEGLSLPVRQIMPAHYGILCFSKGPAKEIANHDRRPSNINFQESMSLKQWYCGRSGCTKKRNTYSITDREPISNMWWDIHRLKHNSKRVDHPCQLPPALMKRIIHTYTKKEEYVLDPFNGAGTTSLVSELSERKFIGIELSTEYHKLSKKRHLDLRIGKDVFAKSDVTPKSKNSRVARLKKQKYEVPKKTLQLEVREIAFKLGRKPERDDVEKLSKYPIKYFDEYFIDWGEVCSAVGDKGMVETPDHTNLSSKSEEQTRLYFDND